MLSAVAQSGEMKHHRFTSLHLPTVINHETHKHAVLVFTVSQNLGTKPTLAVVIVLLALFCSSISLLDTVYVLHFPFGATMEFSDHELSPDASRSDRSSVKFVAETSGPDWEDNPLMFRSSSF